VEKNIKFVKRSFFPHQYEKEEEFLSKMAREGWQFIDLHYGLPTTYEFEKADPVDYVYQLDYVSKDEDTESYHQLFADAGWDEVYRWHGLYDCEWYYFRRERTPGKDYRIYTDPESKFHMYDKLMKKYGLFFLMILFLVTNGYRMMLEGLFSYQLLTIGGIAYLCLFLLFTSACIFYIYIIGAIIVKRNQAKKRIGNRL
jgi:hypothetical protein